MAAGLDSEETGADTCWERSDKQTDDSWARTRLADRQRRAAPPPDLGRYPSAQQTAITSSQDAKPPLLGPIGPKAAEHWLSFGGGQMQPAGLCHGVGGAPPAPAPPPAPPLPAGQ